MVEAAGKSRWEERCCKLWRCSARVEGALGLPGRGHTKAEQDKTSQQLPAFPDELAFHDVIFSSHECYRKHADARNIQFAPLQGDPKQLMQFMVDNAKQSFAGVPLKAEKLVKEMRELNGYKQLAEIVNSTFDALTSNEHVFDDVIRSQTGQHGHNQPSPKIPRVILRCATAMSLTRQHGDDAASHAVRMRRKAWWR